MRPRDVSKCVDHRQNNQAECNRDPDMRNGAAANLIDHDCAGASENESKRPDYFRNVFLHPARDHHDEI